MNYYFNILFMPIQDFIYFSGYASIFDIKDKDGDIFHFGVFRDFINSQNSNISIPLLWQHNGNKIVGNVNYLSEDDVGLKAEGIICNNTEFNINAMDFVKNNILNSLSIGFIVKECFKSDVGRHITKANIQEISLVSIPANEYAKIINIFPSDIK